ncbi:hypothetical protein ALC60_14096 [Trachymyrmex zeteki]|uniref:Uncharacterized protein n=1 Tax=Mycetomoellerius zeteki TaxID=64791 RepID=A0A151WGF9_9HYME|nr:hypothetical protein ALC60_14096 [Trachymyrmex zeteki]
MERLTALFHAFEENSDELAGLDPNKAHFAEFANVQERYYSLAARVVNILHAAGASEASTSWSTDEARNDNRSLATVIQKRRIKLPETSLPTFDGKYKGWLSFKNAFNSMIGSQSDLFDVDKLHYLKSALTGKATNKIRILAIDGTNYAKAWQLLERAYEHVASLSALGVSVRSEIMVHILESKLPKSVLERWETTLERDDFSKIDDMYEFQYKSAVCASKRERLRGAESEKGKDESSTKKKRISGPNQCCQLSYFLARSSYFFFDLVHTN